MPWRSVSMCGVPRPATANSWSSSRTKERRSDMSRYKLIFAVEEEGEVFKPDLAEFAWPGFILARESLREIWRGAAISVTQIYYWSWQSVFCIEPHLPSTPQPLLIFFGVGSGGACDDSLNPFARDRGKWQYMRHYSATVFFLCTHKKRCYFGNGHSPVTNCS